MLPLVPCVPAIWVPQYMVLKCVPPGHITPLSFKPSEKHSSPLSSLCSNGLGARKRFTCKTTSSRKASNRSAQHTSLAILVTETGAQAVRHLHWCKALLLREEIASINIKGWQLKLFPANKPSQKQTPSRCKNNNKWSLFLLLVFKSLLEFG